LNRLTLHSNGTKRSFLASNLHSLADDNLFLIGGWLILALFALFQLRHHELPETARAIWAALILLVPIVGALAFWIVKPGKQFPGRKERA
jgi:hypothetical protein